MTVAEWINHHLDHLESASSAPMGRGSDRCIRCRSRDSPRALLRLGHLRITPPSCDAHPSGSLHSISSPAAFPYR